MANRRFYKSKLYRFKLDGSICVYEGIDGEIRNFKQVIPVPRQLSANFWSPVSFDDDYEVFKCELLEILLGLE